MSDPIIISCHAITKQGIRQVGRPTVLSGARTCRHCEKTLPDDDFISPRHTICKRCKNLMVRYRINSATWDAMMEKQDNKCAICGKEFEQQSDVRVDHDHQTGRVRGLLCHHCNTLLGMANDDPEILRQAIQYITA